jgi:hypothetical protein
MLSCANDFVKSLILCGMRGISFYFITVFIVNCSFSDFVMLILMFQVDIQGYNMTLIYNKQDLFFFNSNLLLPYSGHQDNEGVLGQVEKVLAEFETNQIL